MNRKILTQNFILAIVLLAAIMTMGGAIAAPSLPTESFGLCLPSPNLWFRPGIWNWGGSLLLIVVLCVVMFLINKRYTLLHSSQPFLSFLTLLLTTSFIPAIGGFNSMIPVTGIILIIIFSLFESYKLDNPTRNIFFAASCLSIGSMFEAGCILFLLPLIFSLFTMQIGRLRVFTSLILGIAAPYWIVSGTGLISPVDFNFRMPDALFFMSFRPELLPFYIYMAILMVCGTLLMLYNGLKLYAGNSRIRHYNNVINIFGLTGCAGLMIDCTDFYAYCGILAIWIAMQFGNLFTLHQSRYHTYTLSFLLAAIAVSAGCQIYYLLIL